MPVDGFPDSSVGKESACNAGDTSSIPGTGRSTGEGIGYPLQYSDLENSMNYIVHGVAKSQMRQSDFYFISLHFRVVAIATEVVQSKNMCSSEIRTHCCNTQL